MNERGAMRVAIYNHSGKFRNFGDLLTPLIVERIFGESVRVLDVADGGRATALLAVGSILHLAKSGDGVWGSGARFADERLPVDDVEYFAVRGPRTAEQVKLSGGPVVDCYGDPGLLLSRIPEFQELANRKRPNGRGVLGGHCCAIPHYSHYSVLSKRIQLAMKLQANSDRKARNWVGRKLGVSRSGGGEVIHWISPFQPLVDILSLILSTRMTLSSSLHGMITACAFEVPFRWWWPTIAGREPNDRGQFKYHDFFGSLGCSDVAFGRTTEECFGLGAHRGIQLPSLDGLIGGLPPRERRSRYLGD